MPIKARKFTEKQMKTLWVHVKAFEDPRERRSVKLWFAMARQKTLGADRVHQYEKNPELQLSSRLDLMRSEGRLLLVERLCAAGLHALANLVLFYDETRSGKTRS